MGRLKALQPRLQPAPSRLHRATDERSLDRRRLADSETRKAYNTRRWKDKRWAVLVRDQFTCRMCGRIEADTSLLVCDHIEPHRGDVEKFWSDPCQTLCKTCHDSVKQHEEIAARMAGDDIAGKPASYRPDWLKPSVIPLTIVCGPPAAGKNWYVAERASHFDLIIDLDQIVSTFTGIASHTWDRSRWLDLAIRKRNAMLGDLSKRAAWPAAWLLLTEPSAQHRQWWATTMDPKAIVVIEASEDTCMANAAMDADRDLHHTRLMVRRWWSEYTRRAHDQVVRVPDTTQGEGQSL
jgi:5-methylcytosine-specific restriction endonuclease McrA